MKNKVGLRKIAKELGVSHTTVSLVLNGPDTNHVSKEKRGKILAYVKSVGYRIPAKKKETGNIGFLVSPQFDISDPYNHRFFMGVEEASIKSGKNVIVETWRDSSSPLFWNNKVDGVIIIEPCPGKEEEEIKQVQKYVPVVLLNWNTEAVICDMVVPDNTGGMREAFAYLYKLGHRRIGFFSLVPSTGLSTRRIKARLQGYYLGLEDYKLPLNEEYLRLPACKAKGMQEVEEQVLHTLQRWKSLSHPPTAVITYNDVYGLSFIKKAPSAGVKVPEDLSVIGFDNLIACNYVFPALSSVNQDMEEMGRLSVELLEKRIQEGKATPFKKIVCGTELVIRESIGEVKQR
jgi:DNA-binding LacI/PurR family transcriptional regulator